MVDEFVEVTSEGWFSRLGGAIKGIVFGFLLFLISMPVLFWNEGRNVDRIRTLEEGAGSVMTVKSDAIDPGNDGKLLHLIGELSAQGTASDSEFAVEGKGLALRRHVEMYQWVEERKSEKKKKLGGGTETKTTYKYSKEWTDEPEVSADFKKPEGHENPTDWAVKTEVFQADGPKLGAYPLSDSVAELFHDFEKLPIPEGAKVETLGDGAKVAGEYITTSSDSPEIGDLRVYYEYVPAGMASVVAGLSGQELIHQQMEDGTLAIGKRGNHPSATLFQQAHDENKVLTWILRIGGLLAMFIGITLILRPLSVVADVVPFIGGLIEMGTALVAGLVTLVIGFTVIAVAWIFFRPLIGIPLLLVSAGAGYYLVTAKKQQTA